MFVHEAVELPKSSRLSSLTLAAVCPATPSRENIQFLSDHLSDLLSICCLPATDGNQCSRGSRKRSRKRREDEESTWDSVRLSRRSFSLPCDLGESRGDTGLVFVSLQDKSSGASQLGLRQTPRPRTIFQAGLTPHAHGKPRRQSRKQEHGTSPVNSRECAAIKNIKHVVHAASLDAADLLLEYRKRYLDL